MTIRAFGILTAAALAVSVIAAPTPSNAFPFLIPVIIGAVVVGGAVAAGAANNADQNDYRRGSVSVGPDHQLECHTMHVRTADGSMHRRRVCE